MNSETRIRVTLANQQLVLHEANGERRVYQVSTALNGAGERVNSECTPRGLHRVRLVIGHGCPANAVFTGRRFTGEIYTEDLAESHPGRDWILSRILWLTGTEPGLNRGGECDTLRRYIYIHGTPDSEPVGIPRSHGCIRMRNRDVIDLARRVGPGTPVLIEE
jgi:hypothetical protein